MKYKMIEETEEIKKEGYCTNCRKYDNYCECGNTENEVKED